MIVVAHKDRTETRIAAERVAYVAERLNPASTWADTFAAIVAADPERVALHKWIAEGVELDTLQVHVHLVDGVPDRLSSAWSPGPRVVSDVRSSFFQFDTGSRRDFAGLTCYAATADYWVGFNSWNNDTLELVVYRAVR